MGKNVDFISAGSRVCSVSVYTFGQPISPKMSLLVKKFTNPLLTLIRPLKVLQSYISITLVHCWVQF